MRFALPFAAAVLLATSASAQETERWPVPADGIEAFRAGGFVRAQALIEVALRDCEANKPNSVQCLDLLFAAGEVASYSGDLESTGC